MRTTIEMPDSLWRAARARAARQGATLTAVMEAALRQYLRPQPAPSRPPLRWRTERGTLLPGVDVDSRNALLELLDERP